MGKKSAKPKNYICPVCKKPKVYNRTCQKCGVDVIPRDEYEHNLANDGMEEGPTEDELGEYDTEVEEEHKTIIPMSSDGRPISRKGFIQMWAMPFGYLNKWLNKVDKDGDYRELAEIWMFDEEEMEDILDFVYDILKRYFPRALIWLAGEGILLIIFNAITIFLIFGKKIKRTAQFFMKRKREKKALEEAQHDGRPGESDPAARGRVPATA